MLLLSSQQSVVAHGVRVSTLDTHTAGHSSYTAPTGTTTISAATLSHLSKLLVPQGATLIVNLGNVTKTTDHLASLINFGTISFVSKTSAPGSVTLNVRSFDNAPGATIAGGSLSNLHIDTTNLLNSGIIQDNVSISISSRRSLTITGGVLDAPIINLSAPQGNINAALRSATGVINTNALAAHVGVATGKLNLGTTITRGDPTYFNDAGDISINGNINVGENLSILAAGNITVAPTVTSIQVHNVAGNGYAIALVAGAALTGFGATTSISATPPIVGNATTAVSLSGLPSATGGNIDLTGSPSLQISSSTTCTRCTNSGILLAAFANGSNGGQILLAAPSATDTGTVVTAKGPSSTNSGNITLIAGATSGNSITTGTLNAGGRTLQITNSQPVSSDGNPVVFATTGNITSGNQLIPSSTQTGASIAVTGDLKAGSNIAINAGSGVVTNSYVSGSITDNGGVAFPALNPTGTRLYIPSPTNGDVLVVNTATDKVVATIKTGGTQAVGAIVSPNGALVYVSDPVENEIFVVSTATNRVVSTIHNVTGATTLAISADGKKVFATEPAADSLAVINTTTRQVTPVPLGTGTIPEAIALNKSNGLVYVGDTGTNSISIYSPTDGILSSTPVGFSPGGFGPCPCGTKIFVSDPASGTVRVFSTETNSIILAIPPIPVGVSPQGIGINPTGSTAYVANSGSQTISLISTLNNQVFQTLPVGSGTLVGVAATFVGNNATQFVFDTSGQALVVKTPALLAPITHINTASGDIVAFTGATAVSATSAASGGVIVTSSGNLVGLGGSSAGGYQLATPKNITVNGPIRAGEIDFHAIDGTLTNNSSMTSTGALLFIASDRIVNNGVLGSAVGATSPVLLQAPSGVLRVTLGTGSFISTILSSTDIVFNPAGGMLANIKGNGTLLAQDTSAINVAGSPGQNVSVDVLRVSGTLGVAKSAKSIKLATHSGDLDICACINSDGGSVAINAAAGSLKVNGDLAAGTAAAGIAGGNINLSAFDTVTLLGDVSSNASGGARGGNITINAKTGSAIFTPSTASLTTTGSGGAAGGAVKVTAAGSITNDGILTAGSVLLKSTTACCQPINILHSITTTDGAVTLIASGDINISDAVQSAKSITATSTRGNMNVTANVTTTNGGITLKSGGPSVDINAANITANSNTTARANILIENTNTRTGTITIGGNTSIATTGVGGGNVSVSIGAPSARVGIIPAGVNYSPAPTATGPFFFGTNGINVLNPSNVSMTSVNGGRIVFSTGALPSSAITIDASSGSVNITADPFNKLVSLPEPAEPEFLVNTGEE